jgi:hypothetical protein
MSFSATWLALREPYDRAARSQVVLDAVSTAFAEHYAVTVSDLACGTGSTRRAIGPALPARQAWRLFDNDLGLLGRAASATLPSDVTLTTMPVDLAHDLEAALDGPVDLVATSALLDLVSSDWLDRFVIEIAARRLPVYAALTYDGRATLAPDDPLDAEVVAAVNRHQKTDKGFGPALGPQAAAEAVARFEATGYAVFSGASDWEFGARDRDIQLQIVAGWAAAAAEMDGPSRAALADWLARRQAFVTAGRSTITVGHVDFFAQPMTRR